MDEKEIITFLTSERALKFIRTHENTPVDKVLLNPESWFKGYEKYIAEQLISRRKAKKKLPAWYEKEGLLFPPPLSLEQCSSEITSYYKSGLLGSDHPIIDLTGGSGVDSLAFKGQVTFVEKDPWLCHLFEYNSRSFDKNTAIVNQAAEEFLRSFNGPAAFYMDPARRDEAKKKVFRFSDCTPDVTVLLPDLLKKGDRVLIKASPMIDLKQGIVELSFVREVHVVALKNEVKEVLFLIEKNWSAEPVIKCIDLGHDFFFEFFFSEEKNVSCLISQPKEYLLDPSAAILKAGAFNLITHNMGVEKIGKSTHLYTSDTLIKYFPGRQFKIIERNAGKKEIKKYAPDGKMHVITKNYPLNPEELKRKYKVRDGGDHFLFAFRDQNNKPNLVIANLA